MQDTFLFGQLQTRLKIEHLRKQKDFETLIPNDVFYRDSARAEKQENLSGFLKIM